MKRKVAVIGVGAMGKNHARIYSEMENVELVAIADTNKEVGEAIAQKYGVTYHADYQQMLDAETPDALSLCVPTQFHKDIALDVIRRGIPLLIEKPISSTLEDGKEIVQAATTGNVLLMIGHIERFNPVICALRTYLEQGKLGKIFLVNSERYSPFPKRIVDVGATVDLAVHDVDIMRTILKSKVTSVYSAHAQKIHSAHEDLMTATLTFEGGVIGTVSCNWITPKIIRELTVVGEKGMLRANYLTQELTLYKNEFTDRYIDWETKQLTVTAGDSITLEVERKEPLLNELESFIDALENNKPSPVSGQEGLENLHIALQFLESAKQQKTISL